jgi:hypothetical protein
MKSHHSVNDTIPQHTGFSTQLLPVLQNRYPYSSCDGRPQQTWTHGIDEEDQVHMETEYQVAKTSSMSILGFPYLPSQLDKQRSSDGVITVSSPALVDNTAA